MDIQTTADELMVSVVLHTLHHMQHPLGLFGVLVNDVFLIILKIWK